MSEPIKKLTMPLNIEDVLDLAPVIRARIVRRWRCDVTDWSPGKFEGFMEAVRGSGRAVSVEITVRYLSQDAPDDPG